ncbi:hypothetical protein F4556_002842 [Kitasatospora gansuensis]|uniref:A-factor biosynthesis hotdog domain-containing protein n=1 Tax=Kitasatospora gansuensis TaxID=258050 RepID=A0A7W7WH17_9ACTN|nr:hypothetical protein [Kitasatospora gansuensis]
MLLTGWHQHTDDTFTVTAQWPRAHGYYQSDHGLFDPLLFAETVRQLFPLLSHVGYDVPFGHQLIWDKLDFELDPAALRVEGTPAELRLDITCEVVRRRGELSAMTLRVLAFRDDHRLGTASARFSCHSPAVYRRLRAGRTDPQPIPLPPPAPPQRTARDRYRDVVLSPTSDSAVWQLRTDVTHPVLFDHPVDHVPGMLLIEAARQAVHAAVYPWRGLLVGIETTFSRFAELDAPCWLETRGAPQQRTDQTRVDLVARQHGRDVFTGIATYAHCPAR